MVQYSMNMKTCKTCEVEKLLSDYHRDARAKDGHRPHCKECAKAKTANYYQQNREDKCAYIRQYYQDNKGAKLTYLRQWKRSNAAAVNAISARYRATKLQATPKWADDGYIKLFYELAKVEEVRTGRKVHVDHIVPLQGNSVCGLHCEDNLQLLFDSDNCSKGNSFN